jgi:hypothetical protein
MVRTKSIEESILDMPEPYASRGQPLRVPPHCNAALPLPPCLLVSLEQLAPLFLEVTDPIEVDNWLHNTESNFGLLHCTKYQKILYAAQQL